MGEFSRALGLPGAIKHKGKEYQLAPLSLEVFAHWEDYLEGEAFDALERSRQRDVARGRFDPDRFARRETALIADITAGDYGFFSEVSAKAQKDFFGKGARAFLRVRMQVLQPDVTAQLVDEIWEEEADQILRKLKILDAPDPNSSTPATQEAPGGDASESKASSPVSATAA